MGKNKVSNSLLHVVIGSLLRSRYRLEANIDLLAFSTQTVLELVKLQFVLKVMPR